MSPSPQGLIFCLDPIAIPGFHPSQTEFRSTTARPPAAPTSACPLPRPQGRAEGGVGLRRYHQGAARRRLRYLTDFDYYDIEHLARLYRLASLRGVDRFFMQVRRRLSILERPIATANSARRAWHGYAAYSPKVAQQVLQIFRTYYNYVLVGEGGKTPAMRLGLADGPIALDVLSSMPVVTAIQGTSSLGPAP